ncbi:DHA2 family efflux MFS transporter permease subunit [Acidocella sp.]|uniref:DHA2 family efflux MFS transporter permease subunit n=1 Tax=Acidocella sp. TaxID=50710 RepID=UPI00260967D8|nr:DHA2 family efflux MFS transporter permease subunit [Acidocella sp.]
MSQSALPRSPAGGFNPWMVAVMISLAPFMEVLDSTIANVSLTHIAGSLGAGQIESTWVLTSYLVSNSIILPISGWLARVLGRKRFYLISVVLFTASSVLCAMSTSLDMLIVARVMQGLGGGGLAPAAQSMLADSFPQEKRAQVFALFGFTIIVAPATGPVIGGWLTDTFSWHWIFLINLPIGLVAFTLIAIFVAEPALLVRERAALLKGGLRLDYLGLSLVALGFGTLQIFLDKFELDDGFSSPFICALAAVCAISLSLLVVWEWHHPQPVMNFRLFKITNFAVCCLVMFVVGFVFLASTQLLPQMAQTLLGYTATISGEALALGGMATISLMPVAGIITGRFVSPRLLMAGALIQMGVALLMDAHFSPLMSFADLSWARIVQVIAMPFIFIPISALSYVGVPPELSGEAAALFNQVRNIGSSVGVSFVTTLLAWRTQFHHERLAEAITPYANLHGLSAAQIAPLLQRQASFASYLDVFHVIGLMAVLVWPVVLFLRSPPQRAE